MLALLDDLGTSDDNEYDIDNDRKLQARVNVMSRGNYLRHYNTEYNNRWNEIKNTIKHNKLKKIKKMKKKWGRLSRIKKGIRNSIQKGIRKSISHIKHIKRTIRNRKPEYFKIMDRYNRDIEKYR